MSDPDLSVSEFAIRRTTANPRWRPIAVAPRDGTLITGLQGLLSQRTWWGKASHVPLYGWCFTIDPDDPEGVDLWQPTHWQKSAT